MAAPELKTRAANLAQCPQLVDGAPANHVSIGDLHGNALKLIYTMIEEGVIQLPDNSQYEVLRDIYYKKTTEITKEDLDRFKEIIDGATVNTQTAVTLIGDELADRGQNDYLTLLVLKKLHGSKVDLDIMISNHSAEFIRDYDKRKFTGKAELGLGQGNSLVGMKVLIDRKLVEESEIRNIVENAYIPSTKAIGYTLSETGELTLFTHAPIGLETAQSLAKKFGVEYKEATVEELIETIDLINQKVRDDFKNKQLSSKLSKEGRAPDGTPTSPEQPLQRLVWNRKVGKELRTQPHSNAYNVKFVHGHVGSAAINYGIEKPESHENLDNELGKWDAILWKENLDDYNWDAEKQGENLSRHSSDLTALQLQKKAAVQTSTSNASNDDTTSAFKAVKNQYSNVMVELKKEVTLGAVINSLIQLHDVLLNKHGECYTDYEAIESLCSEVIEALSGDANVDELIKNLHTLLNRSGSPTSVSGSEGTGNSPDTQAIHVMLKALSEVVTNPQAVNDAVIQIDALASKLKAQLSNEVPPTLGGT